MIKIDKHIPIPSDAITGGSRYPFAEMLTGESFFIAAKTSDQMNNAASHWRKKMGMGFTCRNVVEDDVAGCRVWRTK